MAFFDVFLPLSNEQFLKRDFFDSFNGLRSRRLGRKRLGNGKLPKLRTTLKKRTESQPSGARCVGLARQFNKWSGSNNM